MQFPLWDILYGTRDENPVADYLFRNWDNIKLEKDKSNWKNSLENIIFSIPHKYQSEETPFELWYNRDLRISSICANGFRGIADVKSVSSTLPETKERKDALGFGITLNPYPVSEYFGKVWSLVLLGRNGSGKTSIYSALEYLCTGDTSIARKHHKEKKNVESFYQNIFTSPEDIFIKVCFQDSTSKKLRINEDDGLEKYVDLRNFFCSESDLSLFECSGDTVTKYLDECIGLEEVVTCNKFLEDTINDLSEDMESPETEDNKEARLRKREIHLQCEKLLKALKKKQNELRTTILPDTQTIISKLLSDFLEEDKDIELAFSENDGKKLFDGMLRRKDNPEKTISPRTYFNNFRFKLYLISLRIAIAFSHMKTRKILFPLIFDDIFDSSDFTNRLYAKKYFQKIVRIYGELKISESPLQIIFFTQDEVIAEGVFSGLASTKGCEDMESKSLDKIIYGNVILAHLFPPGEIKATDFEDDFYNLYDVARIASIENISCIE